MIRMKNGNKTKKKFYGESVNNSGSRGAGAEGGERGESGESGVNCVISLLTEAGGKKTLIVRRGALRMENGGVSVSYKGENGNGVFFTNGNRAEWSGDGEMKSRLFFDGESITRGEFGLPGLSGEAAIQTHEIGLKIKTDLVIAEVKYTLFFDYGEENMRVKLIARQEKKTDVFAS